MNAINEGSTLAGSDGMALRALESALQQSQKLAAQLVGQMRRQYPEASDSVLLKKLERRFISLVTGSGATVGAAAAVPGVGTAAGVAATIGEAGFFLSAAATHVLAVAHLRGLEVSGFEHERTLVLMVLLGGTSSSVVTKIAERTGLHWGRKAAEAVPLSAIRAANRYLGAHFVTRYGTQRGILVLGRAAPFGFGAAIGGGGNFLLAKGIVKATTTTIEFALAEGRAGSVGSHHKESHG